MTISLKTTVQLEKINGDFVACDIHSGEVHRIEGPAAITLERIMAGDETVQIDDPAVTALLDIGVVTLTDVAVPGVPGTQTARRVLDRRTVIAAAGAVGITTLLLPNAAAASSEVGGAGGGETVVAPAGEAGGTQIDFSWASQPVQFRFAWIRPEAEDDTPFDYEIEVTATYVESGNTPAVPTSFTYGPYPALLSTQKWFNGPAGPDTRMWYPSSWYDGGSDFPNATGNTYTAVFRSLTTPSTSITKTLVG